MNQLITLGSTEPLTMSSKEIATLLDCRHDNVKVTVERLAHRGIFVQPALQDEQFLDALGRPRTEAVYHLGKNASYTVVAQLSPEFTARVVDRWQELEAQVAKPAQPVALTPTQALLGIVQNMVDIEAKQQALALQQQAQAQATAMTQQAVVEVAEKVQGLEDARTASSEPSNASPTVACHAPTVGGNVVRRLRWTAAAVDGVRGREARQLHRRRAALPGVHGLSLRAIIRCGEPWFVVKDVCAALGLKNASDAVSSLAENQRITLEISEGKRGSPQKVIVSESGLYRLISHSRSPQARRFSDWVDPCVLPNIRKHGGYIQGAEKVATGELDGRELVARALVVANSMLEETEARAAQATKERDEARNHATKFKKRAVGLEPPHEVKTLRTLDEAALHYGLVLRPVLVCGDGVSPEYSDTIEEPRRSAAVFVQAWD